LEEKSDENEREFISKKLKHIKKMKDVSKKVLDVLENIDSDD
jgi:hypothetical protein